MRNKFGWCRLVSMDVEDSIRIQLKMEKSRVLGFERI